MKNNIVKAIVNDSWHQKAYMYMLYTSYILFAFALSGSAFINPKYLSTLETILKYYVCCFLILRFNPYFNKPPKTERGRFNQRISYHAGVFLLLTTALTNFVKKYFSYLHTTISDIYTKI